MATSSVGSRRTNKIGSLTPLAVKMGTRSQEIRPVGAWIEPAAHHNCSAVVSDGDWTGNTKYRSEQLQGSTGYRLETGTAA